MTWLSHICFRASAETRRGFKPGLLVLLLAGSLAGGTITGRVELRDSNDPAVRKSKDFSGVVIWLEPVESAGVVRAAPVGTKAVMDQRNKTFVPHVLPIQVGSTVAFPNSDPIFHNAFSNYNGKLFDVGLYPPGTSRSVWFNTPGVVRVFCNIHAHMSAVIVVVNTPYFVTTRKDGSYRLTDVPPGEYTLHVFHERATQATLNSLARRIVVNGEPLTPAAITISESGYIEIPHSNKYGHEYQHAPEDGTLYPAKK